MILATPPRPTKPEDAMPRRSKPLGEENRTWDEINAPGKLSKAEKRHRRLAVSLGATKHDDGRIEPPAFPENPTYYLVFGALLAFGILYLILQMAKR